VLEHFRQAVRLHMLEDVGAIHQIGEVGNAVLALDRGIVFIDPHAIEALAIHECRLERSRPAPVVEHGGRQVFIDQRAHDVGPLGAALAVAPRRRVEFPLLFAIPRSNQGVEVHTLRATSPLWWL
jgi:hypothetical protein